MGGIQARELAVSLPWRQLSYRDLLFVFVLLLGFILKAEE